MATFYEVWDDGTGNRVGGAFATQAEAEALLGDVLRVNGEDVVGEMAIMACMRNVAGRVERTTVLEGADFAARSSARSTPGSGGSALGGPFSAAGSISGSAATGAAGAITGHVAPDIRGVAEQAAGLVTPGQEAMAGGVLNDFDSRTFGMTGAASIPRLGIQSAVEIAGLGGLSTVEQIGASGVDSQAAALGRLQDTMIGLQAQLGPTVESYRSMLASLHAAYAQPIANATAALTQFQESLQDSFRAVREAMAQYDLARLESQAAVLATIRDLSPDPYRAQMDTSWQALFDQQARDWFDMDGQEFVARYESDDLPTEEEDPEQAKKIVMLASLRRYVPKAA